MIVGFIDEHRGELGVESICTALQIAPSTYYAAKRRESEPSARARRDVAMMQVLMVLWVANKKVYGAHKLWRAARRAGHDIGRDQVARLMRTLEIQGVSRQRRKVFTTRQDPDAVRAPDLVDRNFTADRPGRVVGHRHHLRPHQIRDGLRLLHRRRVLPPDRRLAGGIEHEDRHSPRRARDGETLTRRPATDRSRDTQRRRVAIHVRAIHRTSRRDRRPAIDRHDRRLVRQRLGRNDERLTPLTEIPQGCSVEIPHPGGSDSRRGLLR